MVVILICCCLVASALMFICYNLNTRKIRKQIESMKSDSGDVESKRSQLYGNCVLDARRRNLQSSCRSGVVRVHSFDAQYLRSDRHGLHNRKMVRHSLLLSKQDKLVAERDSNLQKNKSTHPHDPNRHQISHSKHQNMHQTLNSGNENSLQESHGAVENANLHRLAAAARSRCDSDTCVELTNGGHSKFKRNNTCDSILTLSREHEFLVQPASGFGSPSNTSLRTPYSADYSNIGGCKKKTSGLYEEVLCKNIQQKCKLASQSAHNLSTKDI